MAGSPATSAASALRRTGEVAPRRLARGLGMSVGIVVPVLNEAAILPAALERLRLRARGFPVVIADGGSTDGSVELARRFFHVEQCPSAGRGAQMNRGARCLGTDVLLFLHADSELPAGWEYPLTRTLADPQVVGGCFQLQFNAPHPMLRFYSQFTRFRSRFFHFGDQGFFVRREVFWRMGGFRETPFLEDVDFLRRLRRCGRFAVLPTAVTTSARRFLRGGPVRQMLTDILLVTLFELGVSAHRLAALYPHVR